MQKTCIAASSENNQQHTHTYQAWAECGISKPVELWNYLTSPPSQYNTPLRRMLSTSPTMYKHPVAKICAPPFWAPIFAAMSRAPSTVGCVKTTASGSISFHREAYNGAISAYGIGVFSGPVDASATVLWYHGCGHLPIFMALVSSFLGEASINMAWLGLMPFSIRVCPIQSTMANPSRLKAKCRKMRTGFLVRRQEL